MNDAVMTSPIAAAAPRTSAWSRGFAHFRYVMTSNPVTFLAFVMLAAMIAVAVFGPSLVPHDPLATAADKALKPPTWQHWTACSVPPATRTAWPTPATAACSTARRAR
jgi:ABC-type dipeptide/oligopeptide/nickel transport system permease subunit